MAAEGFKQTPHSPGCYLAAQGRDEYIVQARPSIRTADKNGVVYKDRRGTTWFAFVCNCTTCSSEAWVRWDVLMRWIQRGIA